MTSGGKCDGLLVHVDKIALENIIFARAACLRVEIYACVGRLGACCADGYLWCLLALYNEFFAQENIRWLAEDRAQTAAARAQFYQRFIAEQKRTGFLP